jgi:hypothetical protein
MKKFISSETSLDGKGKVEPEIIGDAVFVAVGIIHVRSAVDIINRNGVCHRPAGLVGNDTGGSYPAAEMVYDHRIQHMGDIVIRWVGKSVVDAIPGLITVYLYDRT